ncbi:MAG TPA: helix-turn-helix transcriptional regulator [Polyangiaceae bacterium]|nr:helix-turn-helix transcriptional regulator [Polyangiaceae bacterium]
MPRSFNARLLVDARLGLNLTQEQAAALVGVDVRTYRRYESGEVNQGGAFGVRHPSRRRILARIAVELGVAEEELVVASEPPDAHRAVETRAELPIHYEHALPRARVFVGRSALVEQLRAWIDDPAPSARVLALVALGGAGKTTLVEHVITRRGDGPRAAGIFVYSFYDDDRAEAFFERALAYFAPTEAGVAVGDRVAALERALAVGVPHLLVIDGLEVIQGSGAEETTYGRIEDGALRRFLIRMASGLGAARALVTSRFELTDVAAWESNGLSTVRLDPLSDAEAGELLGSFGVTIAPALHQPLLECCGRHALSLCVLGAYAENVLGDRPLAQKLDELERVFTPERLGDRARDDGQARRLLQILSAYARALSPAERDLLARLAAFPNGADTVLLEAIARAGGAVAGALAGRDAAELATMLRRLERFGLVFSSDEHETYGLHPFVAEYFHGLLGATEAPLHALERERLAARLDLHAPTPIDVELLDTHELLLEHTLRSGDAEGAAYIYLRRLGGFPHLGLKLGAMSRGARILRNFCEDGDPNRMPESLTVERRSRITYDLGLYAGALGDLEFAVRCYLACNALSRSRGDLGALSTGLRTLAYTRRLAGAFGDALALVEAAAEAAQRVEARAEHVRAVALRASVLHDLGRTDEASREFARARTLGDRPQARRALWEAEHLLELGRLDAAQAMTEDSLAGLAELGWQGHGAHAHIILGHCAVERAPTDPRLARRHLELAREWTARTGEVEVALRAWELEGRICMAETDVRAARTAIGEGRALSKACGFGAFTVRFDRLGVEV